MNHRHATVSRARRTPARLAIVAACVALLAARPARAQDVTDAARQAFEQGVIALRAGRFADAAADLERSCALRASPAALYNLGLARRGAGRAAAAIEAFERYLERPEPDADPRELTVVRDEVARLRRTLARLVVQAHPPDAAVVIDGRPQRAVAGAVSLDPGRHVIEVRAEGHRGDRREVELAPGGVLQLQVQLAPLETSARLVVEASPASGQVFIDGALAGSGGRAERAVGPGSHAIEIRAAGYAPYQRTIRVGGAGTVRVDATLARASANGWVAPVLATTGVVVVLGGVAATVAGVLLSGPEPPVRGSLDFAVDAVRVR